ncbi:MAG: terminase large subunit [Clostridiales bacterium]|nr:terminase large subunit [Clostridiales bacterium]
MIDYIRAYYQAIKNGSIIVGKWVILLYEYIIKGLENKTFSFCAKKADTAINFIEKYCHHSKGRNDRLKLELWQKALVSVIFGIVDNNGFRQFREVLLVVGRKNGKSLFAAAIAEYMAYYDNEYGAEVYCLAPKLEQADIIYSCFWQMSQQEEAARVRIKARKSDYYIADSNTTVKKIAFNAKKSDGFNPHLVVCDEIASWVGEPGKKQYEVMKSALGARKQPMILSCTTSGYVNEGIYDELVKRGTRFLLGDSKEKRLLPVLYMIDDIDKWNDINELAKSNPNLGVSVSVDYMLEEIAVAEGSLSKKAEFLTKYCCIKQSSSQAWLSTKVVDEAVCDQIRPEDFINCYAVGGVDLSMTTDLTSACVVIEKYGIEYVISHFWLPADKLEEAIARDDIPYREMIEQNVLSLSGEGFVDYNDVFLWFIGLVTNYKIMPLVIGYDRYSSQYLVNQLKNDGGFLTDDVYQGWNMTPAINKLEGELKEGSIKIGDNALLRVHLLDTALQKDRMTKRVKIVKLNEYSHIDGTAALLDALIVKDKWAGNYGRQLKNE